MTGATDVQPKWLLIAAAIGAVGVVAAAVITGLIGSDVINVNVGPVPTVTVAAPPVPGPTVTVPGPTSTVTVTQSASTSSEPAGGEADKVHLADDTDVPEGMFIQNATDEVSGLKINGRSYDFGWTLPGATYYRTGVVVGINTNKEYSRFEARIGLAGDSENFSAKLEVLADNKTRCGGVVGVGKSIDCNFSLVGIQRVEIKTYQLTRGEVKFAVGDPTLTP